LAIAAIAWLGCGGATSQIECPDSRTELDGVCVSESIADYVSCVRAQGAQLQKNDAQKLSADASYAGAKASVVSDVSASLAKKYAASDAAMLEIINTCKEMQTTAAAPPEAPQPSGPAEQQEPGWVRQGPFGAIAVSENTEDFGWAAERASFAHAKAAAMSHCKVGDCKIVVELESICGAVAKGVDNGEYWGRQPTRTAAEERALQECQAKTTGCKLLVWTCSF
jgi:hypothetical protein